MSEHTPAPWHYQERSDAYTHILRAGQNRYLGSFSQTSAPHSEANARRAVACVNAFHDPSGRTIATEDIAEGLFWRLYDFALILKACPPDYAMGEVVSELLRSLKIERPGE